MVDDLLSISKCGVQSIETNTSINTLIELKKLQFHTPEPKKPGKCHFLHVGQSNNLCPGMNVHGVMTEQVQETTYLGDIIQANGTLMPNYQNTLYKY